MLKNRNSTNYLEFVKAQCFNGVLDLVEKEYAKKNQRYKDDPDTSFSLTQSGEHYAKQILNFANKIF
ncbi:MAG: hypothetical protein KJ566_03620 [Nanoarchaeota archaeon]|nr:hypothetical protein [Nanoarchaeota archaeon]